MNVHIIFVGFLGDEQERIATCARDFLSANLHVVENCEELSMQLKAGRVPAVDAVLHRYSDMKTLQTLRHICHSNMNNAPLLTLMTQAQLEPVLETEGDGLAEYDILAEPYSARYLAHRVEHACFKGRAVQALQQGFMWSRGGFTLADFLEDNHTLRAILFLAKSVINIGSPLMLQAPEGSGRELMARSIHKEIGVEAAAFVVLDGALIDEVEFENVVFGGGKQEGILTHARGATLYLRNVEYIPAEFRQRLIKTLLAEMPINEKEKSLFGGDIIFAAQDAARGSSLTKKTLVEQEFAVALKALPVAIPPLAHMADDIASIASNMAVKFGVVEGKNICGIAPIALKVLSDISWPGNLQQLAKMVRLAVMVAEKRELQLHDFPLLSGRKGVAVLHPYGNQLKGKRGRPAGKKRQTKGVVPSDAIPGLFSLMDALGNVRRLEDVEREMIRFALERYSGHMSDVARHLGIGRSTLYRKLSGEEPSNA